MDNGSPFDCTSGCPVGREIKKTSTIDVFDRFVAAVDRHLSFLTLRYSFEQLPASISPPECTVTFRADSAAIVVMYEYLSSPWIQIAQRLANGRWQEAALETLVPKAKSYVFADPAHPVEFDAVIEGKGLCLEPLVSRLCRGELPVKPAIQLEEMRIFQDAIEILERLPLTQLAQRDQAYLIKLRAALQSGKRSALKTLLDSNEQLRPAFLGRVNSFKSLQPVIAELGLAVQHCLQ